MSLNSKTPFIKNNKGSTMLIVSLVIGLLILAVGGYFGYRWYQNKLVQERIAKIEKVQKLVEDIKDKGEELNGDFNPNKISSYKSTLSDIESTVKDLEKAETDKEIKDQVKKCIDNAKKNIDFRREIISFIEKTQSIQTRAQSIRTESEAMGLQRELAEIESQKGRLESAKNSIEEGTCKKAMEEAQDLIDSLKENK